MARRAGQDPALGTRIGAAPNSSRPSLGAASARVLVIDDDPSISAAVLRTLEAGGFNARFHCGPFGSLQAIRSAMCDVVLVDVNMPRLDGPLLVRMIRDAFGLGRIKVVLYSNMETASLERLAKIIGAHGAVPKKAEPTEMVARLRAALLNKP
ncbi:response regulator [Polyangium aurulentum]|uniref:response regulator n=1 Tax=Polyangium aurulentum TaxID=2567896 RepID=UPI00146F910B|nr:response regulator [Polyangium aurulentum]UQA56180.1 response regulator [Polyangium aurulentum]